MIFDWYEKWIYSDVAEKYIQLFCHDFHCHAEAHRERANPKFADLSTARVQLLTDRYVSELKFYILYCTVNTRLPRNDNLKGSPRAPWRNNERFTKLTSVLSNSAQSFTPGIRVLPWLIYLYSEIRLPNNVNSAADDQVGKMIGSHGGITTTVLAPQWLSHKEKH